MGEEKSSQRGQVDDVITFEEPMHGTNLSDNSLSPSQQLINADGSGDGSLVQDETVDILQSMNLLRHMTNCLKNIPHSGSTG